MGWGAGGRGLAKSPIFCLFLSFSKPFEKGGGGGEGVPTWKRLQSSHLQCTSSTCGRNMLAERPSARCSILVLGVSATTILLEISLLLLLAYCCCGGGGGYCCRCFYLCFCRHCCGRCIFSTFFFCFVHRRERLNVFGVLSTALCSYTRNYALRVLLAFFFGLVDAGSLLGTCLMCSLRKRFFVTNFNG